MTKAPADPPKAWTAKTVKEALYKKWPADQYVIIEEAPDDPMRLGRKIDLLAIGCWQSRGYELDAVEVKISMHDWKRELAQAAKADWWWRHVHRFWVAMPMTLATKAAAEVPGTWGLLGIADNLTTKIVIPAPKHQPEPLAWKSVVGLLRVGAGAGVGALARAHDAGLRMGRAEGGSSAPGGQRERTLQDQLNLLQDRLRAFEATTGVDLLSDRWMPGVAIGQRANLALRHLQNPELVHTRLNNAALALQHEAERIHALAAGFDALLKPEETDDHAQV